MKRIFLYGPPASGKTTLGKRLAERLRVRWVDLDEAIEDAEGRSIAKIFKADGEQGFRDLETKALKTVVAEDGDVIVSLGGGTLLRDENRSLCEGNGIVLCLDAPLETELSKRIGRARKSRPLGDKSRERAAHYASFPNRVEASFEAGTSLVVIGSGIAPALLGEMPCVVDENVAKLHPFPSAIFRMPSGERNKTPEMIAEIWHSFGAAGLGRRNMVAAVGGGVTGDMTGFAAATWMRGIDWMNVPTTLLAMVDASTGGKTGCDLPEGKNLVGAFHAPQLVVIDSDFLKTLPNDQLVAGKAEMIKHEVIAGRLLPKLSDNLKVKVDIVNQDPLETTGLRILLNCGHTVAHAIEKLTNYTISHGEAVAIGCVEESRMAVRLGMADAKWPNRLAALFHRAGLSTELPKGIDFAKMRPIMVGDKKRDGDVVTFALPCGFGKVLAVPIKL